MMKGVFKTRPTLPRHVVMYDVDIILKYMKSLPPNEHLLLEELTKKLCMLLCLLTGQRAQVVPALTMDMIHRDPMGSEYVFYVSKMMKTTIPNHHAQPLVLEAFPDKSLCIVDCLDIYLDRTNLIRENSCDDGNQQMIISYHHPYKPVSKATVARYVKLFLGEAGIDTKVFTAHSTR